MNHRVSLPSRKACPALMLRLRPTSGCWSGGASASVAEGWREPESGQDSRIEACHRRDLGAGYGEDHQPDGVIAAGVRVAGIEAERRLAVRPGRDEPGGPARPERRGGKEFGGELA